MNLFLFFLSKRSRYCRFFEIDWVTSTERLQFEAIQNSIRVVSDAKSNVWKNNLKSWKNNLKNWKNPHYIWKNNLESWKNTYQKDDTGNKIKLFGLFDKLIQI